MKQFKISMLLACFALIVCSCNNDDADLINYDFEVETVQPLYCTVDVPFTLQMSIKVVDTKNWDNTDLTITKIGSFALERGTINGNVVLKEGETISLTRDELMAVKISVTPSKAIDDSIVFKVSNKLQTKKEVFKLPKEVFTGYMTIGEYTNGTVTGGNKQYNYGDEVILTALPNNGYRFIGWYENNIFLDDEPTFVFAYTGQKEITPMFEAKAKYNIGVTYKDVDQCNVLGTGTYTDGGTCTLKAACPSHISVTWVDGNTGTTLSTSQTYTFTVTKDMHIKAIWDTNNNTTNTYKFRHILKSSGTVPSSVRNGSYAEMYITHKKYVKLNKETTFHIVSNNYMPFNPINDPTAKHIFYFAPVKQTTGIDAIGIRGTILDDKIFNARVEKIPLFGGAGKIGPAMLTSPSAGYLVFTPIATGTILIRLGNITVSNDYANVWDNAYAPRYMEIEVVDLGE